MVIDSCFLFSQTNGIGCESSWKAYENLLRELPFKIEFSQHSAFVPSFLEE